MFRAMPDPFRPPTPQPPRPEGLPPDPWRPPPLFRAARSSDSPPPGSPDRSGSPEPTPGPALDPPAPRIRWWQRPARWEARLGRWLLVRARVRNEAQARQFLLVGLAAVALGAVLLLVLGAGSPR